MNHTILDANGRFLLSMENYCLTPSYRGNIHSHHYLEISYIKEGKGKYQIDDKVYDIKQGDIFLFNNIEKHVLVVEPPERLTNLVIHFEPRFIWSQTDNSFDSRYLQVFYNRNRNFSNRLERSSPAAEKISNLFIEIDEEFNNSQHGHELMIKVRLLNILVLISRCYACIQEDSNCKQAIGYGLACINKVLDYIDTNIDKQISLEELANIAHMNPSYFSTFFKKYNGINPLRYVKSKRIEKAVEYLKFSDKTITEIGSLCGFNNMTSFYNAFREVTATSPTEYRQK
ncbi:MAG: AraC family transcriptional regulator [Clostridia bacterium]|nr:AraC family transcriptional regulator [Clostridia bacterium]